MRQFKPVYNLEVMQSPPVAVCEYFNAEQRQEVNIRELESQNQSQISFDPQNQMQIVNLLTDLYRKKMVEEGYLRCDCPACEKLLLPFLLRCDFTGLPLKGQEEIYNIHQKYLNQVTATLKVDKQSQSQIYNILYQEVPIQEISITQKTQPETGSLQEEPAATGPEQINGKTVNPKSTNKEEALSGQEADQMA